MGWVAAGAAGLLLGEVLCGSMGPPTVERLHPLHCLVLLLLLLYIAVASGAVVIRPPPRPPGAPAPRKVFVIGLSRTGTSSITTALSRMGLRVYHFCAELVVLHAGGAGPLHSVNTVYADAFDAHTDFAAALVYKELAALYPDACFVLTTRQPAQWGEAMVRFTQTNRKVRAVVCHIA